MPTEGTIERSVIAVNISLYGWVSVMIGRKVYVNDAFLDLPAERVSITPGDTATADSLGTYVRSICDAVWTADVLARWAAHSASQGS